MRAYFATRLSEHLSETPEGFLLAVGVPIARSGTQQYHASELGLTRDDGYQPDDVVNVYRDASEVFSPKTISSFEGKPLVSPHPPDFISCNNIGAYQKGHVQHVREGGLLPNGDQALLADLVITDASLISRIKANAIRELSAGYDCTYVPMDDKQFAQQGIRGNHVAVVGAGRAGEHVKILDSQEGKAGLMSKLFDLFEKAMVETGWKKPTADSSDPIENAEEFTEKGDQRAMARNEDEDKERKAQDAKLNATVDRMNKFLDAAEAKEKEEQAAKDAADKKAAIDAEVEKKVKEKEAKDAEEKKEEEKKTKDAKKAKDENEKEMVKCTCDAEEGEPHTKACAVTDACTCGADKGEGHEDDCGVYKKNSEDADIISVEEMTGEELPINPIPGAEKPSKDRAMDKAVDSAIANLRALRPLIAKRGTKDQVAAYNKTMTALKGGSTNDEGYQRLTRTKRPEGTGTEDSVKDLKQQGQDFEAVAKQFHRKNAGDVAIQREEKK